jgi:hypothetical protein
MFARIALAAAITVTVMPVRAFWDGIDRLAVMAVATLNGDEKLLFRDIRIHDFEHGGGGETRSVCGEVWFDGELDYVRFVQLFGRLGDRPEPIGLPLVAHWTESPLRLDALWASFCGDTPRFSVQEAIAAASD